MYKLIFRNEKDKTVGKINIIEINGKRYDTSTGAHVGHSASPQPKPITVTTRPITVHHESSDHPKPKPTHHHASRQSAKRLSPHSQQRSKTLMRRAVKKPGSSLKRHLRVQVHTGTLVEQPTAQIESKTSITNLDPKRLQRATHVKKSQLIKHFNPDQPTFNIPVTVTKVVAEPMSLPVAAEPTAPTPDFLEQAIQQATSHLEPAPKKPRKHRLHLTRHHRHAQA